MPAVYAAYYACRNAVRLVYIPFWKICTKDTTSRSKLEEDLREASERASSSVGLLISMGQRIASDEFGQMF